MLISIRKRFIFIANSKTGSTTIEGALTKHAEINRAGSPKRKHIVWKNVLKEYSFLLDNPAYAPETFLRFGVLREPASWVLSWYNYRRYTKDGGIPPRMPFEEFWRLEDDWVKNKMQMDHFKDEDGECRFDLLVPLPKLQKFLPDLLKAFKATARTPKKKNKSRGRITIDKIPQDLIDEINDYFKEDYDAYHFWDDKFDELVPDILSEYSLKKAAAKSGVSGRQTKIDGKEPISVLQFPNKNILNTSLKIKNNPDQEGCSLTLKGVVLLTKGNNSSPMKLILRDSQGEQEVKWRMPSPDLAKRYPDNPNAKKARFLIKSCLINETRCAELYLESEIGAREKLYTIEYE